MPNIALLALEPSDATVVLTSISLVFLMLVALCLVITLEGKLFDAMNENKKKKNAPPMPAAPASAAKAAPQTPAAKAPAAKAAAPAPAPAAGGIPGEIIAAIAAAVASLEGDNAVITGIRRIAKPAARSRRGAWGEAGVREHTTPFM